MMRGLFDDSGGGSPVEKIDQAATPALVSTFVQGPFMPFQVKFEQK